MLYYKKNNYRRHFSWLPAVLAAFVFLSGCTEIAEPVMAEASEEQNICEPQPYPVTTDGLVFSSSPERVASLSPAVTEIICALGFGDRLVCRSEYCDYPDEISSLPTAGSAANPNIEAVIECKPQLLISMSPIANKDVSSLETAGINVMIISSPQSNDELFGLYEKLSLIFNGSEDYISVAESLLSEYRKAIENASGSCKSIALILEVFGDSFSVASGSDFAGDYISCFGKNIAAGNISMTMSAEELIAADPEVILLASPLNSDDIGYEPASLLSAFNNGKVYVIDASLTERPTARLSALTESITDALRSGYVSND